MAQTIIVDISTRGANPVAYTHQGDTGRTFFAEIYENGEAFAVAGYTIKVGAILPADRGYTVIAGNDMVTATKTNDNTTNKIYFTLSDKYSLKAGNGILTLIFTSNTGTPSTIRPINIDLRIQKSADADDTIAGASDFPEGLEAIAEEVFQEYLSTYLPPVAPSSSAAANKAADAKLTGQELDDLKSDLSNIKDASRNTETQLDFTIDGTGYVNYGSGTIGTDESEFSHTDYINVFGYSAIRYKRIKTTRETTRSGIAFYDENKQYISGSISSDTGEQSDGYIFSITSVPQNAVYVRCTTFTDSSTFEIYGISYINRDTDYLKWKTNFLSENVDGYIGVLSNDAFVNGIWSQQGVASNNQYLLRTLEPIPIKSGDKIITEASDLYIGWYLIQDGTVVEQKYNYSYLIQITDEEHVFTHDGLLYINIANGERNSIWQDIIPSDMTAKIFISNSLAIRQKEQLEELESEISDIDSRFETSANLFDKSAVTSGYYINTGNGNLTSYSGTFVSDYIPIEVGKTYSYHVAVNLYGATAAKRLPIYNSSKTIIGYINGTLDGNVNTVEISLSAVGVTVTSADMAYCRFTDYLNVIDSAMFVEGEYPSDYEPFGVKYLSNDYSLNDTQIEQVQSLTNSGVLYGKKIAYNGDSIAESRLQSGTSNNGGAYAKIIADITGGTYENIAHGGGILASAVPSGTMPHSVINTLSSMADNADLICLEGGINDYWRAVPLGDYTESDFTGTLDTTTICGALESIFRQAMQKWVGKPIVFVIVHKIKSTVYVANSAGYTFAQARDKMVGICKKYSIPYYDAFAESGLNAYVDIQNTTFLTSNSTGNPDGCHPNESAYKKYYVPQLISLFESVMPKN